MRQRRVSALAAPLSAPKGQQVSAVRAIDLERNRRHERAGFAGARGAAPAGEGLLEELANLAVGIREVAGGGVAVIGGDDHPSPGGQALDKSPEVIAAELVVGVAGQRVEALARA